MCIFLSAISIGLNVVQLCSCLQDDNDKYCVKSCGATEILISVFNTSFRVKLSVAVKMGERQLASVSIVFTRKNYAAVLIKFFDLWVGRLFEGAAYSGAVLI